MNIQDWIPLRLTVQRTLKSLPNATVPEHQSPALSLPCGPDRMAALRRCCRHTRASIVPASSRARRLLSLFSSSVCTLIYSWSTEPCGFVDAAFPSYGHSETIMSSIFTTSEAMQLTTRPNHGNWYVASGLRDVKWPVLSCLEREAGQAVGSVAGAAASTRSLQPQLPRAPTGPVWGPWLSEGIVLEGGMPALCHIALK